MQPFGSYHGQTIGFLAALGSDGHGGIEAGELFKRVEQVTEREPLVLGDGPPRVQSLAIVSGAASDFAEEAAAAGAQALLTGEPAERVTATAQELGIRVIAAGHHATETLGIKALGELLAARFGLGHVFIDVSNPV
jgi:putative NIF3 family GTP cyclohydrolase 1 type 2